MKRSFYILIILIVSGCSTSFKLSPVMKQTDNQKIVYFDGDEVALSFRKETAIGVFGEKTEKGEINLFVMYQNNSNKSININPAKITVVGIDSYGKRKKLKVYSADEYIKKIKREQAWQAFGQALGNISDSYNAGRTTSNTTGIIGNTPFSANTNTYDAGKQAEVNRKNMERMQQTATLNSIINESTKRSLLKKNTLFPNQYIAGIVKVKHINAIKFRISIPIGKEIHKIDFVPNIP